jgi:hypothetical protein
MGRFTSASHAMGSASPITTIDDFIQLGRFGKAGRIPGWVTLTPLLTLDATVYAMPAMVILQPTFLDDKLRAEWHVGDMVLTAVSMAFFAVWGMGALVMGRLADVIGRKPTILGCVSSTVMLCIGCAAAPSFAVYAVCRALLGVPVGAAGAIVFVLCVEWALPSDNALLASTLMVLWSLVAVGFAGVMAATDAYGVSWRVQQLLFAACCATGLLGVPSVPESPRFLVAQRRTIKASALLHRACARAGVPLPEGSGLHAPTELTTPTNSSADIGDDGACGSGNGDGDGDGSDGDTGGHGAGGGGAGESIELASLASEHVGIGRDVVGSGTGASPVKHAVAPSCKQHAHDHTAERTLRHATVSRPARSAATSPISRSSTQQLLAPGAAASDSVGTPDRLSASKCALREPRTLHTTTSVSPDLT